MYNLHPTVYLTPHISLYSELAISMQAMDVQAAELPIYIYSVEGIEIPTAILLEMLPPGVSWVNNFFSFLIQLFL